MNDVSSTELESTPKKNDVSLLVKREDDDLFELDYYSNPEDEAVSYLRQMLRLSKRKVLSKKIDNNGKVRWARCGVEASKVLLYSGVIERSEQRRIHKDSNWIRDTFQEILQQKNKSKESSTP
ncbi:MAG: hypothetical protein KGI02_06585 [Thaumarchaeota archaeon]|nr:hypothetical protein [Nitrososphaerota archaeon]